MAENRTVSYEGNTVNLKITIETDACDIAGTWKPSAVLTIMQLATHFERETIGIGWSELAAKGALWVVSRVNLKFSRIPKLGEEVTVQATALPAVKLLFPWKFRFSDSSGETIGEGSSLWNLMDAKSRRITFIPGIGDRILPPADAAGRLELPEAAQELACPAQRIAMRPVFTDLDINGHVSHIRYIDWSCNALGYEKLRRFAISSFRISFMQEVRPESVVDTELRMDDSDHFSFSGYNGDSPAFIIDGTLVNR